ncbi:MAG: IS66 family insertion sequence element accessory protein TnpB [Polyangiaceae bacterium]
MLGLSRSTRIYFATESVDLRRGHDGLCAIVQSTLKEDAYSGALFVFLGMRMDRCKILFWERGGLVVYYKRLEKGRFRLPRKTVSGTSFEMDATELTMMLDGIDVKYVRRPSMWEPKKKSG